MLTLLPLIKIIVTFGLTFGIVKLAMVWLGVTFSGMWLALMGYVDPFRQPDPQDSCSANLSAGPVKAKWRGGARIGVIVAGLLMLVIGLCELVYFHQPL
jgi:hypothetical protein